MSSALVAAVPVEVPVTSLTVVLVKSVAKDVI